MLNRTNLINVLRDQLPTPMSAFPPVTVSQPAPTRHNPTPMRLSDASISGFIVALDAAGYCFVDKRVFDLEDYEAVIRHSTYTEPTPPLNPDTSVTVVMSSARAEALGFDPATLPKASKPQGEAPE